MSTYIVPHDQRVANTTKQATGHRGCPTASASMLIVKGVSPPEVQLGSQRPRRPLDRNSSATAPQPLPIVFAAPYGSTLLISR